MSNSDHAALAEEVLRELDAFVPTLPNSQQLGVALPPEWFAAGIDRMRGSLVAPYTLMVDDAEISPGQVSTRAVVIVADDQNQALLAFDPNPDGDFIVVWRRPGVLALSHIRGDAVGCFLAI